MTILNRRYRPALHGAAAAALTLLAACGGGGSSSIDTPVAPTPTPTASTVAPPTKFACTNVAGPVDTAQFQITSSLVPQVGTVPQVGATLQTLVLAVAQLLDLADAGAIGLQALAANHDAASLTGMVEQVSVTTRCALAPMSQGLAGIQSQLPAGTSIPQIANAQSLMAQIAALLDSKLGSGVGSGLPNGLDTQVLANLMNQLSQQMFQITGQVQTQFPATTRLPLAMTLLNVAMTQAWTLTDSMSRLDHAGIAESIQAMVDGIANQIGAPLPTTALNSALATLTVQLTTIAPQLDPVLNPLLNVSLVAAVGHLLNILG